MHQPYVNCISYNAHTNAYRHKRVDTRINARMSSPRCKIKLSHTKSGNSGHYQPLQMLLIHKRNVLNKHSTRCLSHSCIRSHIRMEELAAFHLFNIFLPYVAAYTTLIPASCFFTPPLSLCWLYLHLLSVLPFPATFSFLPYLHHHHHHQGSLSTTSNIIINFSPILHYPWQTLLHSIVRL